MTSRLHRHRPNGWVSLVRPRSLTAESCFGAVTGWICSLRISFRRGDRLWSDSLRFTIGIASVSSSLHCRTEPPRESWRLVGLS